MTEFLLHGEICAYDEMNDMWVYSPGDEHLMFDTKKELLDYILE